MGNKSKSIQHQIEELIDDSMEENIELIKKDQVNKKSKNSSYLKRKLKQEIEEEEGGEEEEIKTRKQNNKRRPKKIKRNIKDNSNDTIDDFFNSNISIGNDDIPAISIKTTTTTTKTTTTIIDNNSTIGQGTEVNYESLFFKVWRNTLCSSRIKYYKIGNRAFEMTLSELETCEFTQFIQELTLKEESGSQSNQLSNGLPINLRNLFIKINIGIRENEIPSTTEMLYLGRQLYPINFNYIPTTIKSLYCKTRITTSNYNQLSNYSNLNYLQINIGSEHLLYNLDKFVNLKTLEIRGYNYEGIDIERIRFPDSLDQVIFSRKFDNPQFIPLPLTLKKLIIGDTRVLDKVDIRGFRNLLELQHLHFKLLVTNDEMKSIVHDISIRFGKLETLTINSLERVINRDYLHDHEPEIYF